MNILRLMAKDVWLQRGFLPTLVLLEIGGVLVYFVQLPSEMPGVAFGLLHGVVLIGDFLICYRTMVAEEKNRALLFVKGLPVSTAEIVSAKFGVNLLLVSLNASVLLGLWGGARALGWLHARPALTVMLVISGITWHCLNNAFFLGVAWAFDSEHAVSVPFPVLFIVITVIINFRKVEAALRLEGLVADLTRGHLHLVVVWLLVAALLGLSVWAMNHKRVFA
jgi:hypothetical protein